LCPNRKAASFGSGQGTVSATKQSLPPATSKRSSPRYLPLFQVPRRTVKLWGRMPLDVFVRLISALPNLRTGNNKRYPVLLALHPSDRHKVRLCERRTEVWPYGVQIPVIFYGNHTAARRAEYMYPKLKERRGSHARWGFLRS